MFPQWEGFKTGNWQEKIDVRNFIQKNYKVYEGDSSFLAPISSKTAKVWVECRALIIEEIKKGIIDVDTDRVSGIDNFDAGYIDRENEVIVGLQTDAPLKRIVNPFGGMRVATSSCESYGYKLNEEIHSHFSAYRK
ncbi:MAG: pyruvate formate lyase family protein, partial [Bacilli bacterium]